MPELATDFFIPEDIIPPQTPSVHGERIDLTFSGPVQISLLVDARPGCGGMVWPAGEVLANYIASKYTSLSGHHILELGAGTGLVGLVAGALGATVSITDQQPMLGIMQRNIELNNFSGNVTAMEFNWGEALNQPLPPFTMVLAADCVYFEPAFAPLVETLHQLASQCSPKFLFCYKRRRNADKRFFQLLRKHFLWSQVSDDPRQAEYRVEGISLYELQWKGR